MKNLIFTILLTASFTLTSQQLFAQGGTSSGSVGAARAGFHRITAAGKFVMPRPDFFRVEEFVNYHRHDLPLPQEGERVRLNVQDLPLENGKTVYQFGITAPRVLSNDDLPPLNLVLVIDESGSMGGSKIANLKSSLLAFVERFRKNDRITIVGFTQSARIILEAQERTNVSKINNAIDDIRAGGSTNLHAGLMCGYEMALKHFDPERTNRMIFLTDGNANVGVTESAEIARESKRCVKKGISLITIGLGVDMNNGLLRAIADSGRGLMHYIGDAKDIQKTFIDEFDSVLAPAAQKVRLKLEFWGDINTPKVYGYEKDCTSKICDDGYELDFRLDDLNHGATQVVLVRLPDGEERHIRGKATLTYRDVITGKKCSTTQHIGEPMNRELGNRSIKRNYAIALVASSIQSAARLSNDDANGKAQKKLKKGIAKARETFNDLDDQKLRRVIEIAEGYRKQLK